MFEIRPPTEVQQHASIQRLIYWSLEHKYGRSKTTQSVTQMTQALTVMVKVSPFRRLISVHVIVFSNLGCPFNQS